MSRLLRRMLVRRVSLWRSAGIDLAIPSGDRAQARVHVPAATIARLDDKDGLTTGDLDPVAGTSKDFNAAEGRVLDELLNNNFWRLTRTRSRCWMRGWLIRSGAMGFGWRGFRRRFNTVHLYSPKNGGFAAIEEQF